MQSLSWIRLFDMLKIAEVGVRMELSEGYKTHINNIIKSNREIFIMLSILNGPMCGYDVIKNIFAKYDVFLSQGAVYPILYSMEEEELLWAEYGKGDMRSKNYNFTIRGEEYAQTNIDAFANALKHVVALVKE